MTQKHTPWPTIIEAAKQHLKWIRDTYPSAHSTAWHAAANYLEADIAKTEAALNAHDELVAFVERFIENNRTGENSYDMHTHDVEMPIAFALVAKARGA